MVLEELVPLRVRVLLPAVLTVPKTEIPLAPVEAPKEEATKLMVPPDEEKEAPVLT